MVNGLYAVGECACVSVHGANRLGTNSLLDLLVFGKAAGATSLSSTTRTKSTSHCLPTRRPHAGTPEPAGQLQERAPTPKPWLATSAPRCSQHAGVFRTQASMDEGVKKIAACARSVASVTCKDKSKVFNTARIEALEVDNLIEVAQATMVSAAARKECRGAHTVYDYEHPADHPEFPLGRNDQPVDEAHPVVQRRQPPGLQTGQPQAPDSGKHSTQSPDVLNQPHLRAESMKRTFQIYRYDPDKDAKPYMQTIEIELDGHERMLLDA